MLISGSSAGCTMFRGIAHSICQFPLHFSPRASPCAIMFQLDSTGVTRNSVSFYSFGHNIWGQWGQLKALLWAVVGDPFLYIYHQQQTEPAYMVRPCSENGRRNITQNSIEVDTETRESTRKTEEKLDGGYKEGHERKKPK